MMESATNFIGTAIVTVIVAIGVSAIFCVHKKGIEEKYIQELKQIHTDTKQITDEGWKMLLIHEGVAEYVCDPKTGEIKFNLKKPLK
jgi:hypothetical protein